LNSLAAFEDVSVAASFSADLPAFAEPVVLVFSAFASTALCWEV
jgi:hypothetical protein